MSNKVWIELQKGTAGEMAERAEQATKMLNKLNPDLGVRFSSIGDQVYTLDRLDGAGYLSLDDNGHWFNLESFIK
jgi:hypothetical protein